MLPAFIKFTTGYHHEDEASAVKETLVESQSAPPETRTVITADEAASVVSSLSDHDLAFCDRVKSWDKIKRFGDYVQDGLCYLNRSNAGKTIMLYESPSSANRESAFWNSSVYRFHDYPPASNAYKTMLGPCRYAMMTGDSIPTYLQDGAPPAGMMEHWEKFVPRFVRPTFVAEIPSASQVYAYLPCESVENHVNDPYVHYHLAGKDALHLMTKKTPKRLSCTKVVRPCIAKVTHSMASKGIFVICNDDDEAEFEAYLAESGNPTFVVTDFVEIERNVACHFFLHPNGEVTWFGSNENYREVDGRWSMDSYLIMADQDLLRDLQMPYVKDVVQYCQSLGFFGFCGVDVLFDRDKNGYLVDVNPRVTGSCPSLMVAELLKDKCGFEYGLFRRNGNITFPGSAQELFAQVEDYNVSNEGTSIIILFGVYEVSVDATKINIGVYGNSLDDCRVTLNRFAQ